MPATPYAKVMMVIDGAGAVTGGQIVAGNNVVQLQGESTTSWRNQTWEIYEYPSGFALPAGWTNVNGIYQNTLVTPPSFTISAAATRWGKYFFRLTVNDGLLNGEYAGPDADQPQIHESSALSVLSPSAALHDVGFRETNQFDTMRQWVGELKLSLRAIESALAAAGGVGAFVAGGDLTGSTTSQTTAKLNGATVPAAGALTVGTIPRVTGASALGYGALDLANAAAVTGVLPTGNVAATLTGKTLTSPTISGTPIITATSMQSTGNARRKIYSDIANIQTTNATPDNLFTWTITDEAVTRVDVDIDAIRSDGAVTASYSLRVRIKRDGGTVTVGTVEASFTDEEASFASCAVTIDNSTSTGRVRVTGLAATTIDWSCTVVRTETTHA